MKYQDRQRLPNKALNAGFTLIELMIAMLISLILVFACTALYSSLKSSILLAQNLSNAQESLRSSFYLMSRSVRQAQSYAISGATLTTNYAAPPAGSNVYSCLGNLVSGAASSDIYRSDGSDLYCHDGSSEQLVALDVTKVAFAGINNDGLKVTLEIPSMPATYASGMTFTLALRQKVLLDLAN